VTPGSVNGALVSNIDFAETFLEAAGLPVPVDMQGSSLVPLLSGRTPDDWRKSFYYEYFEYPQPHHVRPHHGVVTARYKLVRFDHPDLDAWELFDREKDPHELRSVYDGPAYAGVMTELTRELAWLRSELKVPAEPPPGASGQSRADRGPQERMPSLQSL
jgi:arylsulfatase A-like enzyme